MMVSRIALWERAGARTLEVLATVGARTEAQLAELVDLDLVTVRMGLAPLYDVGWAERRANGRVVATDLGRLVARRRLIEAWQEDEPTLVAVSRDAGASWAAIGDALGVTRQSAWERYAEIVGEGGRS